MRFTALALGALGLAGFAVGEADPMLTRTIKSHIVSDSSTRTFEVTPIFHVVAAAVTSSHSIYSESCGWGYFPIETTRPYISCSSFWTGGISGGRSCTATATWVGPGCSQTLCSSGSVPIQPTATSDSVSCFETTPLFTRSPRWVAQFARATPAVADPLPAAAREAHLDAKFAARATQGLDKTAGREARLDAKFAVRAAREAHVDPQFESLPEAAREARMDAKFAARAAREAHVDPQFETLPEAAREARLDVKFAAREAHLDPQFETLPEAAREAHLDAKFAARDAREAHHVPKFGPSHAITPVPRAAQITPPPFPLCSFDLDKGEYICPEKTKRQALPLCSFDLDKGEYVCPPSLCTFDPSKGEYVCPKVAARTAMPEEIGMVEVVATTLKTVVKV